MEVVQIWREGEEKKEEMEEMEEALRDGRGGKEGKGRMICSLFPLGNDRWMARMMNRQIDEWMDRAGK